MAEAAAAPLDRAQKLAQTASTVAVVVAIIIVVTTFARDIAGPTLDSLRSAEVTPDLRGALALLKALAVIPIVVAPNLLLAGAVYELSKVLDEYGKGQFFTLRASVGVRKAGEDALWALAFKIVISPTVYAWVTGEPGGVRWNYESFDLGLIAFAAFVAVLGRVLEAAARIKQENDEII